MFDNTITLTRGGTSVVLTRLNQDKYTSEYSLLTATEQHKLYIRHSTERPQANGAVMQRHNVTYERTVYGNVTTRDVLESVSVTIRHQKGSDPAACLATALAGLGWMTSANATRVIAGEP